MCYFDVTQQITNKRTEGPAGYKNLDSNSTKTLQQLSKEYLTKLGCGNVPFPQRSVELAGDAFSEEIWGYVLRHMKEPDVNPTVSTIPKASTNASFIKEDVKQMW